LDISAISETDEEGSTFHVESMRMRNVSDTGTPQQVSFVHKKKFLKSTGTFGAVLRLVIGDWWAARRYQASYPHSSTPRGRGRSFHCPHVGWNNGSATAFESDCQRL
jgi:hypothetical protein